MFSGSSTTFTPGASFRIARASSGVSTVPAPANISPAKRVLIVRIASAVFVQLAGSACGNVTSTMRMPPFR